MNIDRHNVYFKTGGLCHLTESDQDVIGKLVGFFILNIIFLDNDAELPLCIFIAPELCVAQFHSSFKNLFLQSLADVRRIVQSL